ncbi:glycosyltransferase family 4 protein [Candidatus Pseudothioglobus singularis]|nr:glycosyltransferase family 4 protein [Candidatus Pseudothioglobus singularis]
MNKKIYLIRSGKTKFGGAENYLSRLSKALEKNNIDHQVINSPFPKFLSSWIRSILFNIHLYFLKQDKFFYSLDRITCPDLYRAGDGVHKVFLSIENKSKLNLLHPTYLYLEKKCFNNAKLIIANSKMVKNDIIKSYDINPNKIEIIYNGIEFKAADYQKSFKKLSKEFRIIQDQPILLYVGSGFKRKGVEEFLRIVAMLKTKGVKAFVVGKENNMSYYQNLSRKLNIDNQIFFTGPRVDINDFYTISDIFLFPTHYDPFSNVVLEAMYFENAVFTTRSNGASEILDPDFIMNSPYDKKVATSIDNLLSNIITLNKVKIRNKKISKQFPIEKNLKKTLEVINKIEKSF